MTYWSRYPYQENWAPTWKTVKGNDIFFPTRDNSGEFYITIKDLIEITKKANIQNPEILAKMDYWSKIIDDPDYKKDIALKDDRTTLRAVLTKRKFLLPTYVEFLFKLYRRTSLRKHWQPELLQRSGSWSLKVSGIELFI